jgi:hypothetical protein
MLRFNIKFGIHVRFHLNSPFICNSSVLQNNPYGENLHCSEPLTVQPSKTIQFVTPPASSDSLVSSHYHSDSTRHISCHMQFCVVLRNPERVHLSVNGLIFRTSLLQTSIDQFSQSSRILIACHSTQLSMIQYQPAMKNSSAKCLLSISEIR